MDELAVARLALVGLRLMELDAAVQALEAQVGRLTPRRPQSHLTGQHLHS
ncbi:MAG: hypothetical protein WKF86_05485 [Acidimicrobiales bacterium]